MSAAPTWHDAAPAPAEYLALRAAAGMGPRTLEAAEKALPASLFAVTLRAENDLIAMGRIIGDGGCFAQITDMAVAPDWQRRGYGAKILTRLMEWTAANLPACCHLSLVSAPRAEAIYHRAGFDRCRGMDRYVGAARLSPSLATE